MCPTYRCPVDDNVFQTTKIERPPTLQGHPECPGPECRKKFSGGKVAQMPAPVAAAPVTPAPGQDWTNAEAAAGVEALTPPPAGQGW